MADSDPRRVIYVPRADIRLVSGGDIVMMLQLKRHMRGLGFEIEFVPATDLEHHPEGDLLHLTQLHQLDVAYAALEWANRKRIPIVITPLFEEVLPMWFRWAIRHQPKWRTLSTIWGPTMAEAIYTAWQMVRRLRNPIWLRQREILQRSSIITNTQFELAHLQKWFRLPDLASRIVPLGVDVELYGKHHHSELKDLPPILLEHSGQYILEVGLISMRKNQVGLLKALAGTQLPIVLVGLPSPHEPDYVSEAKALAHRRGNVIFIDRVEERALPSVYSHALAHVLPSWSERPGLVSLEAAASGCRVISSTRAPIQEYLDHLAWYVNPADRAQIRDVIFQASQNEVPPGLREMALQYSWANSGQKMAHAYSRILSGDTHCV